ncbi:MAG: hypothetical protein JST66_15585 [Bacteroidetes bacterium]|nr:hypothetical protein [Bacteroidota bacterium]
MGKRASFLFLWAFSLALGVSGQSAIRAIAPYDLIRGFNELGLANVQLGLGFDHDLNDHLAFGVDVIHRFEGTSRSASVQPPSDLSGWEAQYRSYYLLGDHERTSFYAGSWIGLRHLTYAIGLKRSDGTFLREEGAVMSVPVGVRFGVRGGLEGFFLDAFVAFGYAIGGSVPTKRYGMDSFVQKPLSGAELRAGINFGFGWDGRSH